MMDKRILIVEDELHIREALKINFIKNKFNVLLAKDGREALEIWEDTSCDLIILDVMLPYVDGLSVLKRIRDKNKVIPILILSAKDQVEDRIEGLSRDADDYLGKPFHFEELLLRCKRLLERKNITQINTKDIKIDIGHWTLSGDDLHAINSSNQKKIDLTDREYKLIKYMWERKNTYLSRGELLKNVWDVDPDTNTRTVDIFISRMRKNFEEDPARPKYFISKRLRGYQLKISE